MKYVANHPSNKKVKSKDILDLSILEEIYNWGVMIIHPSLV